MKEGILKEQSKMLQGLAILMMLYHHLFSTPEALGIPYRSLLKFGDVNAELRMAWFFKICVGIYAFVSGYGLCRSLQKKESGSFFGKLKNDYVLVIRKLFSFYTQYWLVFILFVPVGFWFFGKTFVLSEFLLNFIGISSTYNGAWWYVLQYLKMLLTLPLVDALFTVFADRKEKITKLVFYGVIFAVLVLLFALSLLEPVIEFFQPAFYLCFLMGYLIARFRLYELAWRIVVYITKKETLAETVLFILGILAFLLVIICRVKIAKDASSAGLDFIFVPVFGFGFLKILEHLPKVSKAFAFFGSLSTFIWLTHVFYYDHYMKKAVMATGISAGIYFTLLAISTIGALLLDLLYKTAAKKLIRKEKS